MSRTATPSDLIPEAHCVFGVMLRPFSLGHHLLLHRVESPFCGDPETELATPEALMLSAFICSDSFSKVQSALVRGEWELEFSKWQDAIKPRLFRRSRFDTAEECDKFKAYLADGYRSAPVWRNSAANGIKLSAPWECLLASRLIAGGFSYTEAMELYMPAAWYFFHTFSELFKADNLTDTAKWRPVFYTAEDEARLHGTHS